MSEDLVAQALTALRLKDFATARKAIIAFGENNPLELQHYMIKGLSDLALSDWPSALLTFSEATNLFPHQPLLWLNLGVAQENLHQIDEAAESLEHSLSLKPDQGDACGNLSNVYRKQGRFSLAEKMAHQSYEMGASKAQSLNCLGLALGKQGKFEAATKTLQEALRLEPNNSHILANAANLAVDQLKFDEAWLLFAQARRQNDAAVIRRDEGMARLLAGDYLNGWQLYESRLELPTALRIRPACPRYNHEPLQGKKLLLIAEQGLGDTIMFYRYGRLLVEAGAEITWVLQKPLQALMTKMPPGHVLTEADTLPEADYYIPLLSLPLATHKLMPADAPTTPYLRASLEPKLPSPHSNLRKIGIVWTGSSTHERDHERSIPLDHFAPLLKGLEAEFYAPFIGEGLEDIPSEIPIIPLDNLITDFADTASLLMQLDCLVTVDTAAAHLAGALGVKTFLLLPYCPDWRWGITGLFTAWYPSVTMLRQETYGDWGGVMGELIKQLN